MEATKVGHYIARDINGDSRDDRSPPSPLRRHLSGSVAIDVKPVSRFEFVNSLSL